MLKRNVSPRILSKTDAQSSHIYTTLINLSFGAMSGFTAAALTYPTDLVRRRMQLQGAKGHFDLERYENTMDCIRKTIKKEGVKGLYKGMVPCFLKVVPSMAISFTTYELLKTFWKIDTSKLTKAPSAG
jgi:solute carrier family 25 phosphate transporter 23/24/25/41